MPGLVIAENNLAGSNPNKRPDLNIRGRATFDGSANMPLFVVDGTEVSADYVYDMDMNDIESVTVLKTLPPLHSMVRRLQLVSSSSPPKR